MSETSDLSGCIIVTAVGVVIVTILLLGCCACFAQEAPAEFPAPKQLFPVRDGIALADFQGLRVALNRDAALTMAEDAPPEYDPSQFSELNVSSVDLGSLGRGFSVYFNRSGACGATGNCPMALYIRGKSGYRPALHFGGWGSWIVPSPGTVPDIVSAWNMSCCDEIYTRYRYSNGRFVADACAEGLTDPNSTDSEKMSWKACKPGTPTFELDTTRLPGTNPAPTYRELQQLQAIAESDLRNAGLHFDQLPVTALPHWFIVGVPAAGETRVFVYPRLDKGIGSAVLRNVRAEFVGESETVPPADPSTPPPPFPIPALVLAVRSGPALAMRLYFEPGTSVSSLPQNGRMQLQACADITGNSGASNMAPNPAEVRARAVPCSATSD